MGKKSVRAEELEALVLEELRRRHHCADVVQVVIAPRSEIHPITGGYWAPTRVNPGISGVEACQIELWRVCERLGRVYDLAA